MTPLPIWKFSENSPVLVGTSVPVLKSVDKFVTTWEHAKLEIYQNRNTPKFMKLRILTCMLYVFSCGSKKIFLKGGLGRSRGSNRAKRGPKKTIFTYWPFRPPYRPRGRSSSKHKSYRDSLWRFNRDFIFLWGLQNVSQ